MKLPRVPGDFPVVPIAADDRHAVLLTTCGECGRSWDDDIITEYTPVPAGRCPFEAWHADGKGLPPTRAFTVTIEVDRDMWARTYDVPVGKVEKDMDDYFDPIFWTYLEDLIKEHWKPAGHVGAKITVVSK